MTREIAVLTLKTEVIHPHRYFSRFSNKAFQAKDPDVPGYKGQLSLKNF